MFPSLHHAVEIKNPSELRKSSTYQVEGHLVTDSSAAGAPDDISIWMKDGTLVRVYLNEEIIHIRRGDGTSTDILIDEDNAKEWKR